MRIFLLLLISFQSVILFAQNITADQAEHLSQPALKCIQKPYPYKPGITYNNPSEVVEPKQVHPAFFGCYDWHSAVHGHWTLVCLLKQFPALPDASAIRTMLAENLSEQNLLIEAEIFSKPNNATFERTYGWAWLLKLAMELNTWDDPLGRQLSKNIQPLADTIAAKYSAFLPRLTYPVRVGEHTNTAFGLAFAWDYANYKNDILLRNQIEDKALALYGNDRGCPINWEPGGFDFLSPCLIEADLMTRILTTKEFEKWLVKFLPGITSGRKFNLKPAVVSDRTDAKLVHLDGLNLSRAWCLYTISAKLGNRYGHLLQMADNHMDSALPHISSGAYEGEHWLGSFAVYALTCKP